MYNNHYNTRQTILRRSGCVLVSFLAFWDCESFQPMGVWSTGTIKRHKNEAFSAYNTRTPLCATRNGKIGPANGATIKNAPKRKKKKTSQQSKPTAVSKKRKNTGNKTVEKKKKKKSQDSSLKYEHLSHEILTKDQEKELGRKIRRAAEVKASVAQFLEQKRQILLERRLEEESFDDDLTEDLMLNRRSTNFEKGDNEDLEGLSVFYDNKLADFESRSLIGDEDVESWDYERLQETEYTIVNPSSEQVLSKDDDTNALSVDSLLTDEDVIEKFGFSGGRDEMARILVDGALAKEKMISCNIRLVVSIAKKWCLRSTMGDGNNVQSISSLYAGSWSRPSLDEAVQEGVIGLSIAADKFEPERNLKFSTYATNWITNTVRTSFNRAKEGGIRVPPYFHVYHQKYQKAVRKHYQETGMSLSMEAAADSLDLSVERLGFILQRTQTPMSIYAGPKYSSNIRAPAGKAGGDPLRSEQNMELIHSLPDNEPPVLDQIEVSLLRRCLENAMATELSPHERDVLRLRHGLDDGVFRSSREVAEFCGGTISVSDVRSAELRACRKLRSPYSVHTVQLYDFLDFVGADLNTVKTTKSKR